MPSGTGEGDNLIKFCLHPSEGWEKVADRPDEGPFARDKNAGVKMRAKLKLDRILLFALALAVVGTAPARASLLGPVSALKLEQSFSEEVALKCKHKCKHRMHANQPQHKPWSNNR